MSITSEITLKIRALGNERSGSALLELLDHCGKSRLMDVTQREAEEFYLMKCYSDNRCLLCGNIIPEGRMIGPCCEERW